MDRLTDDHVSLLESSNTSLESVMDSDIQMTMYPYSMCESYEARRRFPNAKAISSAQFFGDQLKVNDEEARLLLQKFSSTSTAISSADLFGHTANKPPCIRSYEDLEREFRKLTAEDSALLAEAFEEYKKSIASYVSWLTKLF